MKRPTTNNSSTNHWYDGAFFDLCIAPNQDPIFAAIKAAIPAGSTVLDVGCGTGRLVFQLAERCQTVCGIDPSTRNIQRARALVARRGHPATIAFEAASLEAYLSRPHEQYDFGVISYVLHEVEEHLRVPMLQQLAGSVRTVIVADYRVPRRPGLMDAATEVVEFLAGREHYRGFRSFVRTGGLRHLIQETGLQSQEDQGCSNQNAQILLVAGINR